MKLQHRLRPSTAQALPGAADRNASWLSLRSRCARATSIAVASTCLALPAALARQGGGAEFIGPYSQLTNSLVEVTNFNPEPFTGMVIDPQTRLWAVNPYGSTVVRYDGFTPAPALIAPTGLNPVSIATWFEDLDLDGVNDPNELRILVACNGTHALFMHDGTDGRILKCIRIDSEPADLVVDPDTNTAFVSCQGDQTVVQVNLSTFTIANRFTIPCGSRPGPLYLDRGGAGSTDNAVYVAPALTGNNSVPIPPTANAGTAFSDPMAANGTIRNLDLETDPTHKLPDEDVFRINPYAGPPTITAVVRGAGSLIFDIQRHPTTGELWILSTDSLNKGALDTEPKLRGQFAVNQLKRVAGVDNSVTTPISSGTFTDLDLIGAGYVTAKSLNQARTVEFVGGTGPQSTHAYIASAQSDLMIRVDSSGNRVATTSEYVLPPHAQCYDIIVSPAPLNFVSALCLGTMTIEVYNRGTAAKVASLPLGLDPTPPQIRRGRDIFLDGSRSKDGRFTCASCHPRGMSDLLDWPLRGDPTDEKDIMLTQSLLSISDTFPHHWRGERDLADFNKAFGGLLGAPASKVPSTVPDANGHVELDDFLTYVRSLQAPANPIEDARRVLNDSLGMATTPNPLPPGLPTLSMTGTSARTGQNIFNSVTSFNEKTCAACHAPQSGSDSSQMTEGFLLRAPRAMPIEMAHLRQLMLRRVASVGLDLDNNPLTTDNFFNLNGFGSLHDGREPTALHFLVNNFVAITQSERLDAFRFVEQFDQGMSPAAHWAQRYVQGSSATIEDNIKKILIDGAATSKRWNDVVAIGRFDFGAGLVATRWWYDPAQSKFVADSQENPPVVRTWVQMKAATQAGQAENVFIGVPPGNGQRFGVDHDNDGRFNGDEVAGGTNPWNPDTDGDGWPDGYEIDHGKDPLVSQPASGDTTAPSLVDSKLEFATSRLAKYQVRFDEDVTYEVHYTTTGMPPRTFKRDYFSSADTFVLTHENPSTPVMQSEDGLTTFVPTPVVNTFNVDITMTNRAGLTTGPVSLSQTFDAGPVHFPDFAGTRNNLHVQELEWVQHQHIGSTLFGGVRVKLDYNYGAPTFSLLDNFEFPAGSGQFPFKAQDRMVFFSVAVKQASSDTFTKVTSFTTSHDKTFQIARAAGNVDYEVAPGSPWICSPHTGANEDTTIFFQVPGLSAGDVVKVSVMGALTPVTPGTAGPYKEISLQELQPLFLEDSMELTEDF